MSKKRRPLLCRLGMHDRAYVTRWATGAVEVRCSRCGVLEQFEPGPGGH